MLKFYGVYKKETMMKYFLDTEFYEDGKTIDLISIGIVAEDGRELYAVSQDAQLHMVSNWVRANVLPQLPKYGDPAWMPRVAIAKAVMAFVRPEAEPVPQKPIFWAYYADYDWVALCQLFGTMMDLPSGWPMYCMDLKQLSVDKGSPRHPANPNGEHNALVDAQWNRDLYTLLMSGKAAAAGG
jgi:3' exoribonuclease, RNase T-like